MAPAPAPRLTPSIIVRTYLLVVLAGAAFPRLARRLRWATRAGPRGLALYIASRTAYFFALHQWVMPLMQRRAAELRRAKAELAERVGREPSMDEWVEHRLALAAERKR